MKIYKLTINKVYEPQHAISSNFIAARTLVSETFYMKKEDAEAIQKSKYEAAAELFGLNNGFEAIITEVNVNV